MNRGFWEKMSDNPWVPLGAALTGTVLASGLFAFYKGKANMSQNMMRLRVIAQGATVLVLVVGSSKAGIDFTAKTKSKMLDEKHQ